MKQIVRKIYATATLFALAAITVSVFAEDTATAPTPTPVVTPAGTTTGTPAKEFEMSLKAAKTRKEIQKGSP